MVSVSSRPVAGSPSALWYLISAARVLGPTTPSIGPGGWPRFLSALWASRTARGAGAGALRSGMTPGKDA